MSGGNSRGSSSSSIRPSPSTLSLDQFEQRAVLTSAGGLPLAFRSPRYTLVARAAGGLLGVGGLGSIGDASSAGGLPSSEQFYDI